MPPCTIRMSYNELTYIITTVLYPWFLLKFNQIYALLQVISWWINLVGGYQTRHNTELILSSIIQFSNTLESRRCRLYTKGAIFASGYFRFRNTMMTVGVSSNFRLHYGRETAGTTGVKTNKTDSQGGNPMSLFYASSDFFGRNTHFRPLRRAKGNICTPPPPPKKKKKKKIIKAICCSHNFM